MSSPRRKGLKTATAYVAGNDVFSSDLSLHFDGGMRISFALSAPAILYIRHGGQNIDVLDSELVPANSWRSMSMPFPSGESFNVRFSANCTIRMLYIDEASDSNL